ncbi:hypothetical protein J5N97_026013 [Dioscorea zingiberensis]|uniref:Uncharacterized protein n=1 Tax=Dioscorea zingiberensis TaxID=325984 RepID=A0A9D5H6E9_9LILI|nr:hypothetical protein J5N97_026013 [Dioscorea zingiberensis]
MGRVMEGFLVGKQSDQSIVDDGLSPNEEEKEGRSHKLEALQADLKKMNEENQRLRVMLNQVTNNYTTLNSHLLSFATERLKKWGHENWASKSFRDGRYMVECPSVEITKQLEASGPMKLPEFTMSFETWTPDLWKPKKLVDVRRVKVHRLSHFGWSRDSAVRMLKPVGDLVYVDGVGLGNEEDIRALIGVRRNLKLPTYIYCRVGTRKHSYLVELDQHQRPLPTAPHRQTGHSVKKTTGDVEANMQDQEPHKDTEELMALRIRKGKAQMSELPRALARGGEVRQKGIVLREPADTPVKNRFEANPLPMRDRTE